MPLSPSNPKLLYVIDFFYFSLILINFSVINYVSCLLNAFLHSSSTEGSFCFKLPVSNYQFFLIGVKINQFSTGTAMSDSSFLESLSGCRGDHLLLLWIKSILLVAPERFKMVAANADSYNSCFFLSTFCSMAAIQKGDSARSCWEVMDIFDDGKFAIFS